MTSENKNAELASQRLAAIVEFSDDAIISKDLHGVITSWNNGAEKIFGYSDGEMIGTSIMRLIPADRQDEEEQILSRIRRGESVEHFETVRVCKDGSRLDVSVTVSPIKDGRGKIVGASKVARDITERKKTESALEESESRLRLVLQAAQIGHWEIDPVTRSARCSDLNFGIFGYAEPFPEWSVQKFFSHLHPDDRERVKGIVQNGLATQQDWRFESRIIRQDQAVRWISAQARFFQNIGGHPLLVLGICEDITGRKQSEEKIRQLNAELEQRVKERTAQLEAANKELEAFSFSVSHDLRAPLRAVNGFADIVLEDYGSLLPEDGRRNLERIRNGGLRMGQLIDDLLAFSRLSRQSMKRQEVNSARLVQIVLDESQSQREGRQIELNAGNLPVCHGDPALLKQVWVNLIYNAIKYTRGREPSVIEIGCIRKENENVYFVKDNGAGFDMKYADKLFGVFQRLHRADQFEGTGVGLAIVQRIVNRHGGRAWAEAEVNRGATFYFTLERENKS